MWYPHCFIHSPCTRAPIQDICDANSAQESELCLVGSSLLSWAVGGEICIGEDICSSLFISAPSHRLDLWGTITQHLIS